MTDLQELITTNNAIIITGFLFVVMIVIWIIGGIGVPFIGDSPDTFQADESVSITETDDEIIVELDDESRLEYVDVLIDGEENAWDQNNTVVVDIDDVSNSIQIDTLSEGEVYDTYVYEPGSENVSIESDSDDHLKNQDYEFTLNAENAQQGDFGDVEWYVEDELVEQRAPSHTHTFDDNVTYTMNATTTIDDITYITEKDFRVLEPGEVAIDAFVESIDEEDTEPESESIDVEMLEELEFGVEQVSNESIQSYEWDLGDGAEDAGESVHHWYREAGEFNVTVTATAEETEESDTEEITVNVSEPEEEIQTHRVTINTFDDETGERLENATVSAGDVEEEQSGSDGQVQFELPANDYTITTDKQNYTSVDEDITISDNAVIDMLLPPESDEEEEEEEEEVVDEEDQETEDPPSEVHVDFSADDASGIDADAPESYTNSLENMAGNGTREDPYIITTVEELQAMQAAPGESYALGNNINAIETHRWNSVGDVEEERVGTAEDMQYELIYAPAVNGTEEVRVDGEVVDDELYDFDYEEGVITADEPLSSLVEDIGPNDRVVVDYETDEVAKGFDPIDSEGEAPEFDARGYSIDNLYINRPSEDRVGLFTEFEGALIRDITLNGVEITGDDYVGGVVGDTDGGVIEQPTVGGTIEGDDNVGGVVGNSERLDINEPNTLISISGGNNVGGIAGSAAQETEIDRAVAHTADNETVIGDEYIGGIVGYGSHAQINESYTMTVLGGDSSIGGLAGLQGSTSEIHDAYASASVVGDDRGGLVGSNSGDIQNAYWDRNETGVENATAVGGEHVDNETTAGLDTGEMQGESAEDYMESFDFENTWNTTDTYPELLPSDPIEEDLQNEVPGFSVTETDDEDEEDIDSGEQIVEPASYWNFREDDVEVRIIESGLEMDSFTLDAESGDAGDSYQPSEDVHPSEHSARFDGFVEEENQIDVIYTALDSDGEEIEHDTYDLTVDVVDEDGAPVDANIGVDDDAQSGQSVTFEDLLDDGYVLYVDADGYQSEEQSVTIDGEDKDVMVELQEEDEEDNGDDENGDDENGDDEEDSENGSDD